MTTTQSPNLPSHVVPGLCYYALYLPQRLIGQQHEEDDAELARVSCERTSDACLHLYKDISCGRHY